MRLIAILMKAAKVKMTKLKAFYKWSITDEAFNKVIGNPVLLSKFRRVNKSLLRREGNVK